MRYLAIFSFFSLLITGCAKDTFTFHFQTHIQKSSVCKDVCTTIHIEIPVVHDHKAANSINQQVFNAIRDVLWFGEDPIQGMNYAEITQSFINSYEEMVADFDQEMIPWEAKITGEISYQSEHLINIVLSSYTFTGGAHGYAGSLSLLFDAKTGHKIVPTSIFKDIEKFKSFAEEKFRKAYEIPAKDPINSTGLFMFSDVFVLPENIIFNKDEMMLLYNTYEIASYADGAFEVIIPLKEAQKFLKVL
jgi:hypothetical protein